MNISAKDWDAYVKTLRLLSDTAANKLQAYINKYGIDDATAIAEYAHALITKYGEGSAELACQMYDAIGQAEGVILPSAVPAPIPTRDEVERAVLGSFAQSPTGKVTASIADRYVKLAAEDTMARNAIRDRAEWAWVPHGDTCAFCITLASRGWQIASKRILRGGHAEHVHAHCDCQFAIRHDGKSNVSGYDPDKYYQMYKNAEGKSPKEKIKSLRRELEDRDLINAQKREAYAVKTRQITKDTADSVVVNRFAKINTVLAVESNFGIHISENSNIKQFGLSNIEKSLKKALMDVGYDKIGKLPEFYVLTQKEMGENIFAAYNYKENRVYMSDVLGNKKKTIQMQHKLGFAMPNDPSSTARHELYHWLDAEEFRKDHKVITDENKEKYLNFIQSRGKMRLEEEKIDMTNVKTISQYAYDSLLANDYDEAYTEFRTAKR